MDKRSFSDGFLGASNASRPGANALVAGTPVELARVAPFRLGTTDIDPPTHRLLGHGGTATLEPRAMQVLVTLAASSGNVMTRNDLLAGPNQTEAIM